MSTLLQKVQSGELTPIIYMPMVDSATCHVNYGTGGNFVQNGTLDTASRGANQDNCVASYFDGTADYLNKLLQSTFGRYFIISFIFKGNETGENVEILSHSYDDYSLSPFRVRISGGIYPTFYVTGDINRGNTAKYSVFKSGQTHHVTVIMDCFDWTKDVIYVDGKVSTFDTQGQVNGVSGFRLYNYYKYIGNSYGTSTTKGTLGELYLNITNSTFNLATSNPFWDKDTNRPKPVRQVIAETGITPLIAMPLDASNAGKNYGTGGDFVANSAPYVGARGGSEFWARSAKFDGSTGYLNKSGINSSHISSFSAVIAYKANSLSTNGRAIFQTFLSSNTYVRVSETNGKIRLYINDGGVVRFNQAENENSLINDTWCVIAIMYDSSTASKIKIFVNGVNINLSTSTFISGNIPLYNFYLGVNFNGSTLFDYSDSQIAMCYFTTDYIDFSQEVNRNKFIDQLGYPKDLKAQIDAGVIPKPLIYLPFDDTSNLGKNLGTGGNFTVNGTVTQGADVNG